jgi:nickel-type superoxide dismutase maturation protease
MAPTLLDGDKLFVLGVSRRRGVRAGDVVVAEHPRRPGLLVVKRAVRLVDGGWWLLGDNEFVTSDSREYGAVPQELIRARAVLRLRDPVRVVRISRLPKPEPL